MIRKFVVVFMAILMVMSVPASASFHGDQTAELDVVQYEVNGEIQQSFVVRVTNENDSMSNLHNWVNSSEQRKIIDSNNNSNLAVVSAPGVQVSGSTITVDGFSVNMFSGQQLTELPYVESVTPNYVMSYTEPVSNLATDDAFPEPETIGVLEFNDPERPTKGISFQNDTNRTTMAQTTGAIDVDGVSGDTSTLEGPIAVIDTGANTANGTIFGNGTQGSDIRIHNASKNFITDKSVNATSGNFTAIQDGNLHGTWTASAIGANASNNAHDGMAPNAELLVLKALDDEGSGSTSDIASSIRYAADHNASVISLSLGSPIHAEEVVASVEYAIDQGSVVVVAAGNSRMTRSPGVGTPGDVPGAITVGATNYSDNMSHVGSAYFSQYAGDQSVDGNVTNEEPVDVVAPGMQQTALVAGEDGFTQNYTISGTSMATPEVAGGIYKAMAANSTLASASPEAIHENVTESAKPVENLAVAEAGHGMFSAGNLASGQHPEMSQEEAMTDPAQQRQNYYDAASETLGGGIVARVLDGVGA